MDADAAVRERLDGIVGEGRPEQVAADTFESLAVAAVDGGRGVQVHAEGRDRPRRRLGVGSGGGEARASEGLLDTGRERGVEVELGVRVLREDGVVDSSEDGDGRQNVVHEERSTLGHAPAHARRAEAAALAREGHAQLVAAAAAGCPHEALREVSADGEAAQSAGWRWLAALAAARGALARLLQSIGFALDRDDLGVMAEAIDEGHDAGRVREYRAPVRESPVGGHNRRRPCIPSIEHLKEQIRGAVIVG